MEILESKEAPAALTITPPNGPATPAAATVSDTGCENGIDAHANEASNGVVACEV
jgi:hypothetical protein